MYTFVKSTLEIILDQFSFKFDMPKGLKIYC